MASSLGGRGIAAGQLILSLKFSSFKLVGGMF